MENMNSSDLIAIAEAREVVKSLGADATLEDKLRAAMKSTHNNWLIGRRDNDGQQLRAACAAVCLEVGLDSPDGKRVAAEHLALAKVSRSLELLEMGTSVDLGEAIEGVPENPIGLLKLWHEVRE